MQKYIGLLALAVWRAQAAADAPAAGGTCLDPDPAGPSVEEYNSCPVGFERLENPGGICTDVATCNTNCCERVSATPAAGGKCSNPNPSSATLAYACPNGYTALPDVAALACESTTQCDANCCEAVVTVTETFVTTSTLTPWDSSSGSMGDGLASSDSSGSLNEKDMSGSGDSWGFHTSGSSGFNLPVWLWTLLGALACCLVGAMLAGCTKPKKAKKKAAPKPVPKPVVEEEPLLPPLMPVQPSFVPITTAMPTTTAYATPMSYQQPITTTSGYGYGGFPGAVV